MAKKTKNDPTGLRKGRKIAGRLLDIRLTRAQRRITPLITAIPRTPRRETVVVNATATNATKVFFDYSLTAEQNAALQREIAAILNDELLETQLGRIPPSYWWNDVIERPYRQGTAEQVVRMNQLVAGAISAGSSIDAIAGVPITVEQVLTSRVYREALAGVFTDNFASIKTLSDKTAAQVIQTINSSIQSGQGVRSIVKEVGERFNVGRSGAERIARTEVNKAFTDATMATSDLMAERVGLKSGVLHISALSTDTRRTHRARHGKAFSTSDQNRWWNRDANRINCLCSVVPILIDDKGNVIDQELQEQIRSQA